MSLFETRTLNICIFNQIRSQIYNIKVILTKVVWQRSLNIHNHVSIPIEANINLMNSSRVILLVVRTKNLRTFNFMSLLVPVVKNSPYFMNRKSLIRNTGI